ncbi:rho GTPase-activating protein 20-like isoform X3 [Rattus norvegicus]|uniref:rho GTPase-activating protein 20-like isoform X3 n=1 Tax=Rattus norvegicus TaxID=10116 RepID=UPI001916FD56|nr:rho GTPase-activating protein 20-like isoform X3 [Rattus norvegicus]
MGEIHRTLLCQGPVELTSGRKRKKRYLSLFDDVLVVSTNLTKKKFKIKCIIPLNYLWVVDDVELVRANQTCTCKTIFFYWATGNALATFRSKEQKVQWYTFLTRSINEAKKGIMKTFPLQIFPEDIQTCDSSLCVTATNMDTVNDIMEKLLPMIRVHNIEDYQLWFCPGHREAPRALQGHEYPYDIIMNNIQNNLSKSNSKIFTAFPPLPGLFMENQSWDARGQFILKPRDSAGSQQQDAKKRRRKSCMTSCFHGGCVPHHDQECSEPRDDKRGKLFGQDLSSISQDGKLPTIILEMLSRIKDKGPTTDGIFLLTPNGTLCKTIKERLDNGENVDIHHQSVHVVAWILKEFLQSIKGSLLTSKLYDQWLAVPEKVNDKEKLAAVKSLLEKLPKPNADLLRQLFRILHQIKTKSSVNHMSSFSLSLETALCILWLPSYRNKILTNDIAKKISLVTFMIDNSPELFGEDVVAVWYETSLYHPPGPKDPCSQNTPSSNGIMEETEHGLSSCPASEKGEGNEYTTQPEPIQHSPTPETKKELGNSSPNILKDVNVPAVILDMLSLIAEKGQCSDDIFRMQLEKSHWSLREKVNTGKHINLKEESVLTVACVVKDFIQNIKGSLLSCDLYENWLSVPDEGPLLGKITAIQNILLMMPKPNYVLLKQLIRVLQKIKAASTNHLDSFDLSVRIAPHVLWNPTYKILFGRDLSKKLSIIQIMIDNCQELFGENDNIFCEDNQKSYDINLSSDTLNTSGKATLMIETIDDHDVKTSKANTKELEMSSAVPHEGGPTAGHNGTTSKYNVPQEKILHD